MNTHKDSMFDKRAAAYDGFEGRASGTFYRLLLDRVTLAPDMSVLDVGCGTGTILRRMADKASIHGFGIDASENMIAEAKAKCPDMDIRVSACEHTPFGDRQFDALTTCMAYHHFADKKGFAKEAARILKPDGVLYICDLRFPGPVRKVWNGFAMLFGVVAFFGTEREIFENFREYGFELDSVTRDGYAQVVKLRLAGGAYE